MMVNIFVYTILLSDNFVFEGLCFIMQSIMHSLLNKDKGIIFLEKTYPRTVIDDESIMVHLCFTEEIKKKVA